ncbi:hypothetical protein A6V25_30950 [Nostoc sp. ATCC 53789]|nr:hypothetical protein A6V25_30950 [Nostoc sp. ATCC 53789]
MQFPARWSEKLYAVGELKFATSKFFSHDLQSKIKPFQVILPVFGYILALYLGGLVCIYAS